MSRDRIVLGKRGEDLALDLLRRKGFELIERGYRTRLGELDLVMRDNEALVFVEVRTRSSGRYGSPEESVDLRKQRKLIRMAQQYLQNQENLDEPIRFDVVAVLGSEIRHIPDAFRI